MTLFVSFFSGKFWKCCKSISRKILSTIKKKKTLNAVWLKQVRLLESPFILGFRVICNLHSNHRYVDISIWIDLIRFILILVFFPLLFYQKFDQIHNLENIFEFINYTRQLVVLVVVSFSRPPSTSSQSIYLHFSSFEYEWRGKQQNTIYTARSISHR